MTVRANCPGCGAEISFTTGAAVRVCDHCSAIVARRDRDLTSLGKVVDLVETESPLELELAGRWRGDRFRLVGHTQIQHEKGGIWDEWYAIFDDGRWGWLAEAQGRFTITFEVPLEPKLMEGAIKAGIKPGNMLPLPGGPWQVIERGTGERRGARGEIPFEIAPQERFAYADLSGPEGGFGTLDLGPSGDPEPVIYVGREVTLADLGLENRRAGDKGRAAAEVATDKLSCPHCGGAFELFAAQSERVACPYCGGMSDIRGTTLEKLALISEGKEKPSIPLGSIGVFAGKRWRLIGYMRRSTMIDGERYGWDEYLLYLPSEGFRWLTCSDGHWSWVESISAGPHKHYGAVISHGGRAHRAFQRGTGRVDFVQGEFYWKVSPDESVQFVDFIAPPWTVSCEIDENELNWSRGRYLTPREVGEAFKCPTDKFPPPLGVAPNQPYPHKGFFKFWGLALAAVFVLGLLLNASRTPREVLEQVVRFEPQPQQLPAAVWFSEPFELSDRHNVEVSFTASPLQNSWVFVEGDLVDEENGWVQEVTSELEYYSGPGWSEGATRDEVVVSAPPAGKYTLRLEVQRPANQPLNLVVKVRQGVPRALLWLLTMLLISILPIVMAIHYAVFESSRWQNSTERKGG